MRKNINIDDLIMNKLKILSAFEEMSVKSFMERAIVFFVEHKLKERLSSLTNEEKEDLGLLLLMEKVDRNNSVSETQVMAVLKNIQ